MTATLTVGGTPITMIEDSFDLTNATDERQRLKVDAIDYTGTLHFQKGAQVVLTDPILGGVYTGNLNTDKEVPVYPTGAIIHSIDCIDPHYYADKRTVTSTIATPMPAGVHVVKQWNDVLKAEGINANAAFRQDTSAADFAQGILSGTIATTNVGDGNLELAKAGSDVTITEATTANFSTGTLVNMVAASNTLSPATVSGLTVSAQLPYTANNSSIYVYFWSGSKALGTNDTLNYDLWVSSTSPAITATVGLTFTDGTTTTGILDQSNLAIDPSTDLTSYAKDQWYTRNFSTTTYNGKTIAYVWVAFGGASQGTYTAWVKNVYLTSDPSHPFFSTTATATQLSPMKIGPYINYLALSVTGQVLPVFDPNTSLRTSTAYSIDAAKLLKSSVVTWAASTPGSSSFTLKASYDGGVTYQTCTNNAALPALPAGSNLAGMNITLQESFGSGSNPSAIPSLTQVNIAIYSAPNATKSDIVTTFATQTAWNTGAYSGSQALVSGDLTMVSLARNWNDNLITSQTFFTNGSGISQAATGGKYTITMPVSTSVNELALSRLDFVGTLADFTLDVDVSIPNTFNNSSMLCIAYRQTNWPATPATDCGQGGYTFQMEQSTGGGICRVQRGTNSSTDTVTTIATGTQVALTHVRIVCTGTRHQIYFNNSTSTAFDFTDATYTSGQVALGAFTFLQNPGGSPNSGTFTFDNFSAIPPPVATWTGPATSISSLVTCGPSVISWVELNTGSSVQAAVVVQSSVDGGSTFQTCTNGGAIPNLPSGTNVSGKSVQLLITLAASGLTALPIVRQLVWRVLGQYPGSSGTRSTAPMVTDTLTRANVSGSWGTSFDGQSITQVGTGTTNLTSNEGTIANTTGDCNMVYGSRTATDQEATVRFQLSASTVTGMIKLRYTDSTHYYELSASTTTLSIIKQRGSTTTTLGTASVSLSTGTWYRLRFRVVGSGPINFYGRVWADGTLEPTTWGVTGTE